MRYNEAVDAGEIETAWERGRKEFMRRDAAAMQTAREAWVDEDHQDTPQAIGSLRYIHPDSIEYGLNSPKIVGKHGQGEWRNKGDCHVLLEREA